MASELVLTLSCPDRPGIVHAVSGFLAERGCNILDSQQYGSPDRGAAAPSRFFLRIHFTSEPDRDALIEPFGSIADGFAMDWQLNDVAHQPSVLVMVSKEGHCLNDLLYRFSSNYLPRHHRGRRLQPPRPRPTRHLARGAVSPSTGRRRDPR